MIARAKPIPMSKIKLFAQKFPYFRFPVNLNIQFLFKVVKSPDVMIAGKEMHMNPHFSHFGNLSQQANISFWHYSLVFKPEIENVTHQEDLYRIPADFIEPFHQHFFPLKALVVIRYAKMEV